jgi:hypothetical protein
MAEAKTECIDIRAADSWNSIHETPALREDRDGGTGRAAILRSPGDLRFECSTRHLECLLKQGSADTGEFDLCSSVGAKKSEAFDSVSPRHRNQPLVPAAGG